MRIEILTIGNELLDGRSTDTNSAWLGRRLTALGFPPQFRQTVTDEIPEIVAAFRQALSRADVVISTGGLGPTSDDLTFEALAQSLNREQVFHPDVFARIQERFQKRGIPCPESNRKQAWLPAGGEILANETGTAPGLYADVEGKNIFVLPGVPSEMRGIFQSGVLPLLEKRLDLSGRRLEQKYGFIGLPESGLEEKIQSCRLGEIPGVSIGIAYSASFPLIEVTLSLKGEKGEVPKKALSNVEAVLKRELGSHLVGIANQTLEERVLAELSKRNFRLAVAESITGGLICSQLIKIPGSSAVFSEGYVTYSNESKLDRLGVAETTIQTYGAVSEACALEMARGAREQTGVEVGLATTGIAGPSGATEEKPVGLTYIAWVGPTFNEVREYQFRWDRNRNRIFAAYEALFGLIRLLESQKP